MPETIFVAISGYDAPPSRSLLDPKFFDNTEEFKVLSWASITRITNAANVETTTTNARNLKLKFRHIITLTPFLAKTVIASIL